MTSIRPESIQSNVFQMIGDDWALLCTGGTKTFNMMTISWGGMGVLWNKKVCFIFVRPSRYTYELMEKNRTFTLSFFDKKKYKKELEYCGTHSGREVKKIDKIGFKPLEAQSGTVYFQEAKMVLECVKLYYDNLEPKHFLDNEIFKNYSNEDYHRMYIGEIMNCMVK